LLALLEQKAVKVLRISYLPFQLQWALPPDTHQGLCPSTSIMCSHKRWCADYRPIIGIGWLSASLPIIGIGHLTVGIGRLFVLVSKTTKNAFDCSSHWWQWGN